MQDRALGEQVAKAGIYLVFSLSLFAFLFFAHGARQLSAAGAAVEPAALAGSAVQEKPAAAADDAAPDPSMEPRQEPAAAPSQVPESGADDASASQSDVSTEPVSASAGEAEGIVPEAVEALKNQPGEKAFPEVPEAVVPNMYGKEADMAALQAELNRMAGMGFSFSGDVSANYVGEFYATSYCAEAYPHICGGNGVTASGTAPTPGLTVASDWGVLPPGTWIYISGVGIRRVEDSGGAIKGARLDVVLATHSEALSWSGQGNHDVWILA